ncbi:MAG: alpha-hydroxy acid oxidase, partial [Pseudomonadota bacterium]
MTLERQAAETWERDTLSNKSLASEYLTLHEFIKAAKMNVSPKIWDYLVGGTETETTLARNRASLDAIALRPRVLRDVSNVDATSELFGRRVRLPVILAPVGSLESFADGGAVTVAEGAGRFGVAMMMSSVTQQTMEAVRAATAGPLVYQLYVRGDADFVDNEIAKCQDLGFDGFCITVDTQHYSRRERDISKRFIKSWRHADPTMITSQMAFNWSDIARIRPSIKVPFALKGIGTPEDARIAIEHGVDV